MTFSALYERADGVRWQVSSWDTANRLLGYLHPDRSPSACFTINGGSYVQCAGGKRQLTVEARRITGESFKHFRFGKGPCVGRAARIDCGVGPIFLDSSQVLSLRDARLIIRHFVEEGGALHPGFVATDVTSELR